MIVRLPRGALVVLIGPSGCGKSTFAARHFSPTEVLRSNEFRALVADDPHDQAATPEAFELLHRVAAARLRRRRLTVVDATNVEPFARHALLALASRRRAPAVAVAFDVPLDVCLERNRRRDEGRLPEEALRRQHARMQRSLATLDGEGFEAVYRLEGTAAVEEARIRREGGRGQRNAPKELRPLR